MIASEFAHELAETAEHFDAEDAQYFLDAVPFGVPEERVRETMALADEMLGRFGIDLRDVTDSMRRQLARRGLSG